MTTQAGRAILGGEAQGEQSGRRQGRCSYGEGRKDVKHKCVRNQSQLVLQLWVLQLMLMKGIIVTATML